MSSSSEIHFNFSKQYNAMQIHQKQLFHRSLPAGVSPQILASTLNFQLCYGKKSIETIQNSTYTAPNFDFTPYTETPGGILDQKKITVSTLYYFQCKFISIKVLFVQSVL